MIAPDGAVVFTHGGAEEVVEDALLSNYGVAHTPPTKTVRKTTNRIIVPFPKEILSRVQSKEAMQTAQLLHICFQQPSDHERAPFFRTKISLVPCATLHLQG
jgi:hypothetical protein